MAQFSKETRGSREASRQDDTNLLTRTFLVWSDDRSIQDGPNPSLIALYKPAVFIGATHPEDASFRAVSYTVNRLPDGDDLWEVVWLYRKRGSITISAAPVDITEPGYLEINLSWTPQFLDFFRVRRWDGLTPDETALPDLLVPTNGNPPTLDTDILGVPIDEAGRAVSKESLTAQLVFTHVREITDYSTFSTIADTTGTRNLTTYATALPGQLLYKGATANRIAPFVYRLVHTFVYDEWWHMRQVCEHEPDGNPRIRHATGQSPLEGQSPPVVQPWPAGVAGSHADKVYWVQPFPTQMEFDNLGLPITV